MAIPDYQFLMLPVLQLAAQGERRVPEVAEHIADRLQLTPAEREQMLPSGRQRLLHNRVHWAKFYMSKAELVLSPARGRFIASDAGRALLATQPTRIDVSVLMRYPAFQAFYANAGNSIDRQGEAPPTAPVIETLDAEGVTPEEQIEHAFAAMQSALQADLLERILQNTPEFFERLIVDLLVSMGYGGTHLNAATQLGRAGDGGVDGVINEDRLGLDRVYVQAKRYARANGVGRPDVQAFVGSLVGFGATKGVFVTTSSFSTQAKDFVRHLPQRVVLVDGDQLTALMVEHGVGVRTSRTIEFKRLDEDFFSEDV
ncbi:restriction endonuclease [Aureimonas flava]|uniref:Restriction endonuclease n=1 Tax=Aureimonas flava TaxID=2320271 RepID=A0A3A1WK89_9HYPH|nr:restriction endonuclease [Aureimonas flava]RIX99520.1 restriction endonuclease [Aureimonas flava]